MSLKGFMIDTISLKKKDGRIFDNIKAQVSIKGICTDDVTIPFEDGDFLCRILPNGVEETYLIVQANYSERFHNIPPMYNIEVRKTSRQEYEKFQTVNNFNVSGTNSRININSNDNSNNTINYQNSKDLFNELRNIINSQLNNDKQILDSVDALESSINKPTFSEKYNNFIQSVANHITIFAPFIPALSALLVK